MITYIFFRLPGGNINLHYSILSVVLNDIIGASKTLLLKQTPFPLGGVYMNPD